MNATQVVCLAAALLAANTHLQAEDAMETSPTIAGLTGSVTNVAVAVPPQTDIAPLASARSGADIDLRTMGGWAMNYLARTPRKVLGYEPVFQCHPLRCPPVPEGSDVVVPCDTDARLNWEWYLMREVSGSRQARDIEAAYHKRILSYVQPDGTVLSHPGCYNEGDIHRQYTEAELYYHVWGATKILWALSEEYRRTHSSATRAVARKVMLRLHRLAVYDGPDRCYFPAGMGAVKQDGSVVANGWNRQPAPLVEPLVHYYLATHDEEALAFARAYAEGIIAGSQPGGLRIGADGSFGGGHGHATLHAVWGIADLGLVTGERRYVDFAKRCWDWMLTQGTGTGWFPAAPEWAANCNETCCISDMMSIAALIGRSGHPEYFDYVERYLRNYVSNLQFIVTPEFEAYYRRLNQGAGQAAVEQGLAELRKFQGGIIGGSGLNDYENNLLGRASGFEMFGCCAPEGMRAIYTAWSNVIDRLGESDLGAAGVYVNLGLARDSRWGRVVSFFPDAGRLTVKAKVSDTFYLRPPHWAPRDQVHAFVGTVEAPVAWSGDYVRFADVRPGDELTITYPLVSFTHRVSGLWPKTNPDLAITFRWLGNMVVSCEPPATETPLFTGNPRRLPPAPKL